MFTSMYSSDSWVKLEKVQTHIYFTRRSILQFLANLQGAPLSNFSYWHAHHAQEIVLALQVFDRVLIPDRNLHLHVGIPMDPVHRKGKNAIPHWVQIVLNDRGTPALKPKLHLR